jgi:DNA-binding NarL/FixJ family response regulator
LTVRQDDNIVQISGSYHCPSWAAVRCACERFGALTAREAQIALEIAYGKTDHEMAETMGVAFSTIRTHINHLYGKLGIRNRAALARLICA